MLENTLVRGHIERPHYKTAWSRCNSFKTSFVWKYGLASWQDWIGVAGLSPENEYADTLIDQMRGVRSSWLPPISAATQSSITIDDNSPQAKGGPKAAPIYQHHDEKMGVLPAGYSGKRPVAEPVLPSQREGAESHALAGQYKGKRLAKSGTDLAQFDTI